MLCPGNRSPKSGGGETERAGGAGGNGKGFDPAVLCLQASASRDAATKTVCAGLAPGSATGEQTEQQAYELAAQRSDWNYQVNVVDLSC